MKVTLPLLATFGIVLAGCSDGGGAGEDEAFDGLQGTATETTGILRGVVVDDRIVPIVGATIDLRGTTERPNATTDEQGRFLFSDLDPGTYFLQVSSPTHKPTQSSADVEAGVEEPDIVRIQLERLFTQDPFSVQVMHEGYFQCSQAGASWYYSSSNCQDGVFGPASGSVPTATSQDREWHADVGPGWQTIVFEMEWKPTSDSTSKNMGMVVSTYKPERAGDHWFAEFEGSTPIRGQIDVGIEHESASGEEPSMIPPEGMTNMSFFVSVREDGDVPGIAYNQKFTVYVTMFHYGRPPEGWSLVNGDALPF
jgi:hypothetical protein